MSHPDVWSPSRGSAMLRPVYARLGEWFPPRSPSRDLRTDSRPCTPRRRRASGTSLRSMAPTQTSARRQQGRNVARDRRRQQPLS
jgi:hypothetical protein